MAKPRSPLVILLDHRRPADGELSTVTLVADDIAKNVIVARRNKVG